MTHLETVERPTLELLTIDSVVRQWPNGTAWVNGSATGKLLIESYPDDARAQAWGYALLASADAGSEASGAHVALAEALFREQGDQIGLAVTLITSRDHLSAIGRPDLGVSKASAALEIAIDHGRRDLEAMAHHAIGVHHLSLGNIDRGVVHLHACLAASKELGNRSVDVEAQNSLGAAYLASGDLEQALHWLTLAANEAHDLGDARAESAVTANLTNTLIAAGRMEQARDAALTALDLALAAGDLGRVVESRFALGRIEIALDRYSEAISTIERGLGELESLHDPRLTADGAAAYSLAALARPEVMPIAITLLEQTLEVTAAHGLAREQAALTEQLARLLEAAGRDREALSALRQHMALVNQRAVTEARSRMEMLNALHVGELERAAADLASANDRASELETRLLAQTVLFGRMATEDPLTGLYNRRYMYDHLAREILRSARSGQTLSLLLIDIDHFKHINDRFGHSIGDAVLQACAEILRSTLRAEDVISRFGGEEFAVVLPQVGEESATMLAERLRGAVATYPWRTLDSQLQVTVSVGVADFVNAATMDDVVSLADALLYQAKRSGRNRVCSRLEPEAHVTPDATAA